MKNKILLFFLLSFSVTSYSQLPDGDIAPDFSLEEVGGSFYGLYDYLDQGYAAVLDFSATWCGPCWNYHQGGTLESVWGNLGPDGEDLAIVYMIEADPGTTQPCIYGPGGGCSGGSIGDWTSGTSYPILNPDASSAASVNGAYSINYYPTLYGVKPDKTIYEIGQASYSEWDDFIRTSAMAATTYEVIDVSCESAEIDLEPRGGVGQISFLWSNGETTEDLYDVPNGTYYVTLTDDLTGSASWATEVEIGPIEVTNSAVVFETEIEEMVEPSCYRDSDGVIQVRTDGGSGSFTYNWSNGEQGDRLENLEFGTYDVTITDDSNGCTTEESYFLDHPDPLEVYYQSFDQECGDQSGSVVFEVNGGVGPYYFVFELFETTDPEIELEPGYYEVTIEDVFSCQEFASFEIESSGGPMADTESEGMLNCSNSSVFINADSSSVGNNIEYFWFNPDYMPIDTGFRTRVSATGNYILEVRDLDNGCVTVDRVEVMEDYTTPVAESNAAGDLTCADYTTVISGDGSTDDGSVEYLWTTNDGEILTNNSNIEIEVGSEGTYTLEVTNLATGCVATSSVTVEAPEAPEAAIAGGQDFCAGSSTEVCADDVTNSESIEWYVDGTYVGSSRCIDVDVSATVELVITNDHSQCEDMTSMRVVEFESPSGVISGDNAVCEGGSTRLCADDTDNVDSYEWILDGSVISTNRCVDVSGTGDVELRLISADNCIVSEAISVTELAGPSVRIDGDVEICESETGTICVDLRNNETASWRINGQDAGTGECIDFNGTYDISVEVTNADGCTSEDEVRTYISQQPSVSIASPELLDCNNQSTLIDITLDGNYSVSWTDESGDVISTQEDIEVTRAGTYTVACTSEQGCITEATVTVEADDADITRAELSSSQTDDFSFDFSNDSNGETTEILWDFGDGNTSTDANPSHQYDEPGYYTVCLTVKNECGESTECTEVLAYSGIRISSDVSNVSCYGESDGAINVNISGGLPSFTYEWSGPTQGISGESVDGLLPGDYTLVITDETGAQITENYVISEPDAITVTDNVNGTPAGEAMGSIDLMIEGGNGTYTVEWDNGMTGTSISGLERGDYTATITDNEGCMEIVTYSVSGTTNVDELDFITEFVMAPNPASEYVDLKVGVNQNQKVQMTILDMSGKSVLNRTFSANYTERISLNDLSAGIYLVELRSEKQISLKKLFVTK